MTKGRAKNQVTGQEAKRLHQDSKTSWHEWEKRVERLFKANSKRWLWIRIPTPLPKHLAKLLGRGWPDFFAVGKPDSDRYGEILIVECKSGKGRASKEQSAWLEALLLVEGVNGGIFYPAQYQDLVALVGDDVVG